VIDRSLSHFRLPPFAKNAKDGAPIMLAMPCEIKSLGHPPAFCSAALAACAQITCQMVAAAMGIPTEHIAVTVEGDLDLRGTLGISKDVPVGFENIHLHFDVAAPAATPEQLRGLREKTEQYCVVMQTLMRPPSLKAEWVGQD